MPEIEVNIEVFCSCGNGICNNTSVGKTRGRGQPFFEVEPCKKCIDSAKDESYNEGYEKGYQAGKEEAIAPINQPTGLIK